MAYSAKKKGDCFKKNITISILSFLSEIKFIIQFSYLHLTLNNNIYVKELILVLIGIIKYAKIFCNHYQKYFSYVCPFIL